MKHLEDTAAAIDEFFAQEARFDGCLDGTTLGLAAQPPYEVPSKTTVQS
jgi:hypothetical protein